MSLESHINIDADDAGEVWQPNFMACMQSLMVKQILSALTSHNKPHPHTQCTLNAD